MEVDDNIITMHYSLHDVNEVGNGLGREGRGGEGRGIIPLIYAYMHHTCSSNRTSTDSPTDRQIELPLKDRTLVLGNSFPRTPLSACPCSPGLCARGVGGWGGW